MQVGETYRYLNRGRHYIQASSSGGFAEGHRGSQKDKRLWRHQRHGPSSACTINLARFLLRRTPYGELSSTAAYRLLLHTSMGMGPVNNHHVSERGLPGVGSASR